jgi:hypothetical protein
MTNCAPIATSVRAWRAFAILAVLPSLAHLLVVSLAVLGVTAPAAWVSSCVLGGPWSVPVLWALVIGGPLLSVIAGLMLELWPGRERHFGRFFGMCSWVMLIIGLVSTLPLPWILLFE